MATHKVFSEELAAWELTAFARCASDEASEDTDDRLRMGLLHLYVLVYIAATTSSLRVQNIPVLSAGHILLGLAADYEAQQA